MVQGLPLPLLKICDFGYSKAHFMSAPKSKVSWMGVSVSQSTLKSCRQNLLTRNHRAIHCGCVT